MAKETLPGSLAEHRARHVKDARSALTTISAGTPSVYTRVRPDIFWGLMSLSRRAETLVIQHEAILRICTSLVCVFVAACGPPTGRENSAPALDERHAILPDGPPSEFFTPQPVGNPFDDDERPMISNVQIVDLDDDGLPDILVCDAGRSQVSWIRQFPASTYTDYTVLGDVLAPAHAEPTDFDGDGDLDVIVASLGELFPSNLRIGSVIILENDGNENFERHVVAEGLPRVADARPGDLDNDGDLDLAVAAFGHDQGETLWLENIGGWEFAPHVLQRFSGVINAIAVDINDDAALDIVALISQEWEEIWALTGEQFEFELLWGTTNSDFGSSWITIVDLDEDGDPDILHSNGDAFDYAPANSRPWHGVQWLENHGNLEFERHRIADFTGASSPQAADVDSDGDMDVVVVSAYNTWSDESAQSLVWLENDGQMRFAMHRIARSPTHLVTVAVADLDNNGTADLVTGGMHITGPFDRMSRITIWSNDGSAASP